MASLVLGADKVEAMLRQLPGRVAREKVVVKGLRAGAEIVREQAKANLIADGSYDTGLLANTMRIAKQAEDTAGEVTVTLKPSSKLSMVVRKSRRSKELVRARPSKYAHFVERGTEHSAARPFMRPAVDEKGQKAVETIREVTLKGIADEARKLGLTVK